MKAEVNRRRNSRAERSCRRRDRPLRKAARRSYSRCAIILGGTARLPIKIIKNYTMLFQSGRMKGDSFFGVQDRKPERKLQPIVNLPPEEQRRGVEAILAERESLLPSEGRCYAFPGQTVSFS
jgi:hypothetical protein